jgi:hypothetical protein
VFTHTFAKGVTSGRITVPEGLYNVKVEAYYEGILFRTGEAEKPVEVKSGKTAAAPITMSDYAANIITVKDASEWSGNGFKPDIPNIVIIKSDIANVGSIITLASTFKGELTIIGNNKTVTCGGNSLIDISSGSVTVKDLHLVGSSGNADPLVNINGGTFVMAGNSSVSGNIGSSIYGGGVYVGWGTTFTMEDTSSVYGNSAFVCGGVYVDGGTFTMKDGASVRNNNSDNEGGGVFVLGSGTFTMNGSSSIYGNTADNSCNGGGVFVDNNSTFIMNGSASVYNNNSTNYGGGVSVIGTFIMNDSTTVSGNKTELGGGGVDVSYGGTFTMQGNAAVYGNTAEFSGTGSGGGVYVGVGSSASGTFTMRGNAAVYGNTAGTFGGGVYVNRGTFHIQGGTVTGSKSYNGIAPNKAGTSAFTGASLYVANSAPNALALWGTGAGTDIAPSTSLASYLIDETITGALGVIP